MKKLLSVLLLLFVLVIETVPADETVKSTDGVSRYTIRDRGTNVKAIINDKGEKVGYGVRRGSSWTYFVNDSAFKVDEDE